MLPGEAKADLNLKQQLNNSVVQKRSIRIIYDQTIGMPIDFNATGDAGDASPAIFGQPGTNCLISPKVCQNCYQNACRTDAYGATSVCSTNKTSRESKRVVILMLHELLSCDVIHYTLLGCTSHRD